MPSLVVNEGPLAGHRFEVETELTLGRENADLTIEDQEVSRRHAVIRSVENGLEIEDLGSLNGTWVNGDRIDGVRRLASGDVVRLGKTAIAVELELEPDVPERGETVLAPAAPEPVQAVREEPTQAPQEVAAEDPREETAERDELRPVTALFVDIVGSTGLGERLPADEVKALIGECVTKMTRVVEQFGGTVEAYMGDGIAAFFGVPAAHEDDPERAARAALSVLDVVTDYARDVETAWGIAGLNVRVGINSGKTAVGLVGGADPQSVTLGDTANVAARLQSAAEPGTAVVGDTTARRLVTQFVLEPLGELTVKGRSDPVSAWRLVAPRVGEATPEPGPLVGRDAEVRRLESALADLSSGRGQILLLLGDAGIGKSRLVAELERIAGDQVTWLEGQCVSYGELLYWPFMEMLRAWLGLQGGEAEIAIRTKLRAKLGALPGARLPELLPYLARLLSLKLEDELEEQLRALTPEELGNEIRRAYCTWVECLAKERPVVMAVEALQWADPSTRGLAEDLLAVTDRAPLLLTGTLRFDPASEGWGFRVRAFTDYAHRVSELSLAPLDDAAAEELLVQLGAEVLGESERKAIVARAEGNPLYLEELLDAMREEESFARRRTWMPTVSIRALPLALESLLVAKIDRLSEGARRLAQIAAVVGRTFSLHVLEHLAGRENVEAELSTLLRADVVREVRRHPEPEYTFRHGLMQEAALSTLTRQRRRELYAEVGAAFEQLFEASLDDHLELIAHYYACSDDLGKSLDYLERAGEKAAALDAGVQAAELWKRAEKVASKLGDTEAEQRIKQRLAESETQPAGQ